MSNAKIINITDKVYPKLLKKIKNPPQTLYYKGIWKEEIFNNSIAVVGSRRMTDYGRKACEQLVYELTAAGITVVSGFMFGIDITAHRSAILAGGHTIAVMPCGIDTIVPAYEKTLYDQIQETGLIISEYPAERPPKYWTFVQRNRIVAGLCKAVLVIEAAKDSGSLITAEYALTSKRKVFAVPGNILSERSSGTLHLIKEGKAKMVVTSNDILGYYSKALHKNHQAVDLLILELLSQSPMTINDICNALKLSARIIGKELAVLSISGRITESEGRFHVNKS